MSHFILFNISDKDKPHIMFFFLQFYTNFQSAVRIPFSALNSLTYFNTPKVRLAEKNIIIIIIIIMATYSAPKFNKTVAPGASTHHCKTKLEQKANDREL